jgi:hypothetical protein
MGCHRDEGTDACDHAEALDVINEFVLIAHCPKQQRLNNDINDVIQLGNTKYINAPLCKRLGYERGFVPPPGRLVDVVLKEDGKYHGTVVLEHSNQLCIFLLVPFLL